MCPAVEDSGVRLRQAVHDAPFHRISLILSPDVSFQCVGINRTAKHRRFQLQDNGNQCRGQGPIRIDEEDEELRWDSWSSESGLTMGQLRGVLKPVDRDNI